MLNLKTKKVKIFFGYCEHLAFGCPKQSYAKRIFLNLYNKFSALPACKFADFA